MKASGKGSRQAWLGVRVQSTACIVEGCQGQGLETDSLLETVTIMGLSSTHLPVREAEIAAKK